VFFCFLHSHLFFGFNWVANVKSTPLAAEHYEITRYGSLIAWAKQLGRNDCAAVLQKTLDEEKATDKKLTTLAESKINLRAAS
jgi:ferritin-like metal-binding protein YciE